MPFCPPAARACCPFAIVLTLAFGAGCGQPATPPVATGKVPATPSVAKPTAAPTPTPSVATTAERFLQSLLRGDATAARGLLTPEAAQHVDRNPSLLTAVTPSAVRLEVAETRAVSPTEAIAQCLLTPDGADAGDESTSELLCLLREESGIWGVTGLAWESEGSEEPRVLRFEPSAEGANPPSDRDYVRAVDVRTMEVRAVEVGSAEGDGAPRTAAEPADGRQIR